jgi:ABC-type transport system involved in cytochrome c biogenesis permease subunit
MKRSSIPWIVTLFAAALVAFAAFRPEPADKNHWVEFSRLPILLNGRIKPLDTVARTSLLVIHDKQSLRTDSGRMTAMEWLGELFYDPRAADERRIFTIHDPQVLSLFGWQQTDEKHFSFNQLRPFGQEIVRQARLAGPIEAQQRSLFQRHILELYQQMELYHRLKNSLQVDDAPDFVREIELYAAAVPSGIAAMNAREAGSTFDEPAFNHFMSFAARYKEMAETAYVRVVPPLEPKPGFERTEWQNVGESLVASSVDARIHPVVTAYAGIGRAYRAGDIPAFNKALADLTAWMGERYAPEMRRTGHEVFFNGYAPFYVALVIYVLVFVLGCLSWLTGPGALRHTAYLLTGLALFIHSSGILFRMYLEGRPPVTNLYSSAVFVGWGAVLLGMVLERLYRNGVGSVVSGLIGFATLVVAHNLVMVSGGDTMEMMRAVLDSNFWLATHVVTITVGYSAVFLAGFLGIVYIVLGIFTKLLDRPFAGHGSTASTRRESNADAISRMVYGTICFATFFSFIGTVLGGIWADQSWGRFWGWDPKENGAALIVLWCAIILHARWGGYIRQRGLMVMAIFGNVVTAWSWFGTNMLGIGLHSYGFMDKAFKALLAFWLSQLLIMALAAVPLHKWKSKFVLPRSAAGET